MKLRRRMIPLGETSWDVIIAYCVLLALVCAAACNRLSAAPAQNPEAGYQVWPSEPPEDCPFLKSQDITGVALTGRSRVYFDGGWGKGKTVGAETFYPSWASDDVLYTPFQDGLIDNVRVHGYVFSRNDQAPPPGWLTTSINGMARIVGDDPLHLKVTAIGSHVSSPWPYHGRYASANLVYNGVWYYGTYGLNDISGICGGGCGLAPFVGFFISKDYGQTWIDTKLTPANNLFHESALNGQKLKMGTPHFVDFGKNMEYSPDGKAYLVAYGATNPEANLTFISGDAVYMARVTPTPENINDLSQYEFFAGYMDDWPNVGKPKWSKDFQDIKPLFYWPNRTGSVTVTYDAPLKKLLMCVTHGWTPIGAYDTYILEADPYSIFREDKARPLNQTPWKLVAYMRNFGDQAYFINVPSKFISADGRTAWLCYSNGYTGKRNFNIPNGYTLCLAEIKLLGGKPGAKP